MTQIIPTIIAKDFQELQEKIRQVEPYVEWAHLDVMDGNFVDNRTWPYTEPGKNNPSDLKNLESNLKLEAHLMVEKPEAVIDNWIESGVRRIIVHCEATEKLAAIVKKIQAAGLEAGIAINPETPATVLEPFLNVSCILVMTVHPGRGGQEFLKETLGKISILREKYKNVKIEVDGGINLETAGKVIQAGANILAVGSAIFKSEDIKKTIKQLKLT